MYEDSRDKFTPSSKTTTSARAFGHRPAFSKLHRPCQPWPEPRSGHSVSGTAHIVDEWCLERVSYFSVLSRPHIKSGSAKFQRTTSQKPERYAVGCSDLGGWRQKSRKKVRAKTSLTLSASPPPTAKASVNCLAEEQPAAERPSTTPSVVAATPPGSQQATT